MLNLFDDRSIRVGAKITAVYVSLVTANILAWLWAWTLFSDQPALLGTAFLAYNMFGLRHAVDVDHIAAIDNVVRKLTQEGRQPFSVGFFFSFGHSSVVLLASTAIAAIATATQSQPAQFYNVGGIVGTAVSSFFLLVIGVANLYILSGIWSAFSRAHHGEKIVDEDLDVLLAGRGFVARVFRRTFQLVSRSWHMYPVGVLFGLGFDTATEIAVLGISATQASRGMSFWTLLVFPALFTAGMCLVDTTDSVLMTRAYGWASVNPIRKLWYNLTITGASVVVAILIGGMQILGLTSEKLGLEGDFWESVDTFNNDPGYFGLAFAGILIAIWSIATMIHRIKGYERLQSDVF